MLKLLLIRFPGVVAVLLTAGAHAVCPNEDFTTRGGVTTNASINPRDITINAGSATASTPISLRQADMSIALNNGGFDPSIRVSLRPRIWRFRTARNANVQIDDLTVSYVVNADDHLVADNDPQSRIPVRAMTRNIVRVNRGNRTVFRGFVDLDIDYSDATHAGRYRGVLNVTVDCQQ